MNDKSEDIKANEIRSSFTDYEINLLHGLLVDEEIRLMGTMPELAEMLGDIFSNVKIYLEEVKKLRKLFTKIDNTEDYLGVFGRIEDFMLDKE